MKKTTLAALIAGAAILLAAGGIFLWKTKAPKQPEPPKDHGQLVSVRFGQGYMVRTECFRFSLDQKEDGCFLSGDYFDEKEEHRVLEEQEVPGETMEELKQLLETEQVLPLPENQKPFAQDETTYEIELRWEDGTVCSGDSHGSFGPALRRFFEEQCEKYKKYIR